MTSSPVVPVRGITPAKGTQAHCPRIKGFICRGRLLRLVVRALVETHCNLGRGRIEWITKTLGVCLTFWLSLSFCPSVLKISIDYICVNLGLYCSFFYFQCSKMHCLCTTLSPPCDMCPSSYPPLGYSVLLIFVSILLPMSLYLCSKSWNWVA